MTNIPDARLIAAAPRMLEALEDLYDWAVGMGYHMTPKWEHASAILREIEGS